MPPQHVCRLFSLSWTVSDAACIPVLPSHVPVHHRQYPWNRKAERQAAQATNARCQKAYVCIVLLLLCMRVLMLLHLVEEWWTEVRCSRTELCVPQLSSAAVEDVLLSIVLEVWFTYQSISCFHFSLWNGRGIRCFPPSFLGSKMFWARHDWM